MKFKIEEHQSCEQQIKRRHCLIQLIFLKRVLIVFSLLNLIYLKPALIRSDGHADFTQNANVRYVKARLRVWFQSICTVLHL